MLRKSLNSILSIKQLTHSLSFLKSIKTSYTNTHPHSKFFQSTSTPQAANTSSPVIKMWNYQTFGADSSFPAIIKT